MFTYTVYGVTGVPGRSTGGRVLPVSAVRGVHAVQRSWATQYSHAGGPQQSLEVHRAVRSYMSARHQPVEPGDFQVSGVQSYTPKATEPLYIENMAPMLAAFRQPKFAADEDIVQKHLERLGTLINGEKNVYIEDDFVF